VKSLGFLATDLGFRCWVRGLECRIWSSVFMIKI
jgi:hypothetical protein